MTVRINGFLAQQASSSVWLGGKKLKETITLCNTCKGGCLGVRIFAGVGDVFLLQNVKIGSGAHQWIPGFLCGEEATGALS